LQEATALLQGDPVNIYRQADGSAMARWAHTSTLATDAVYFNRELWLSFDAYGRFQRIVHSNNVPLANLYDGGRRVDLPAPASASLHAAPVAAGMPSSPAAPASAAASPRRQGASQPAADPIPRTAVSYPVGR